MGDQAAEQSEQVRQSLSDDEFTVLLIAAEGESMMPIGRWEKSVESLVRKGYLHAINRFNNVITPTGREAIKEHEKVEDEGYRKILEMGSRVAAARDQAIKFAEAAAQNLAAAAKASTPITGEAPEVCLCKWLEQVQQRALELLQ